MKGVFVNILDILYFHPFRMLIFSLGLSLYLIIGIQGRLWNNLYVYFILKTDIMHWFEKDVFIKYHQICPKVHGPKFEVFHV